MNFKQRKNKINWNKKLTATDKYIKNMGHLSLQAAWATRDPHAAACKTKSGRFSNDDGDGIEDVKKAIGLY